MQKQTVDITTPDGVADAYLVRPDGDGPVPGVLFYPDAFGLRPRLEEMAERIAEQGYAVLVPNLLYRGGRAPQFDFSGLQDPEQRGAIFGQIFPLVLALTVDKIVPDTRAYLDYFATVAQTPVVAIGYCMGGLNALRAMEAFPAEIKALGSFHAGRVVTDAPDSAHLAVGSLTGEVYFAHADQDDSMTAADIATLEAALDKAGVTYTSEVYEGSGHGFTMTDTAAYHEAGEKRHWENLFALLERTR